MSPRPWWAIGGPDVVDEPELRACPDCCDGALATGETCPRCDGTGETTGEGDVCGARECAAWDGLL